jgi:hypothetical protein
VTAPGRITSARLMYAASATGSYLTFMNES